MSVLEMVKTKVKELTDKDGPAGDLLNSAKSAVAHGLDGASKFVDDKTNHKYSDTIHTGVEKAKHLLGEDGAQQDGEDSTAAAASSEPSAPAGSADGKDSTEPDGSAEPPRPDESPGPDESRGAAESPESTEDGEKP